MHVATQHYAARTVENIAALGGSWAAAMADGLLINNLVSLWRGTRRAPCCSADNPGCLAAVHITALVGTAPSCTCKGVLCAPQYCAHITAAFCSCQPRHM